MLARLAREKQKHLKSQPCLHTLTQTLLSANQSARTILVILSTIIIIIIIITIIINTTTTIVIIIIITIITIIIIIIIIIIHGLYHFRQTNFKDFSRTNITVFKG